MKNKKILMILIVALGAIAICLFFVYLYFSTARGTLVINVDPSGPSIYIDGTIQSTNNLSQDGGTYELKLKPGKHTLLLKEEDYTDYSKGFDISRNKTTNLNIEMQVTYYNTE
jgi:hypothetical protein